MKAIFSLALLGLMFAVSAPHSADAGPLRNKIKEGAKLALAVGVLKTECAARRLLRKPVGFAC
jgi:hypothetical protein